MRWWEDKQLDRRIPTSTNPIKHKCSTLRLPNQQSQMCEKNKVAFWWEQKLLPWHVDMSELMDCYMNLTKDANDKKMSK